MAADSYKMWLELERIIDTRLYQQTGLLQIACKPGEYVLKSTEILKAIGAEFSLLSGLEVNRLYDNVQLDQEFMAMYENNAGVLMSVKCLKAFQDLYQKNGGCIKDDEKVVNIKPGTDIMITTVNNTYRCRSLVITAGPWTSKLLKPLNLTLPLKSKKVTVCYWREMEKDKKATWKSITPFYFADEEFYGIPAIGYPYMMKICLDDGPLIDPDDIQSITNKANDDHYMDKLRTFVNQYFPSLEKQPSKTEPCFYTVTPDGEFILDTHPVHRNIVIGAGFSGHGFKMAPVVGDILSSLACGEHPERDISPYRIDRFHATAAKSKL